MGVRHGVLFAMVAQNFAFKAECYRFHVGSTDVRADDVSHFYSDE